MLGNQIKKVRMRAHLTSSIVSQYLEMDLSVYRMIENDQILVDSELIEKLCLLYGCNEKVFYHENEEFICDNLEKIDLNELRNLVHFRKVCAQIR